MPTIDMFSNTKPRRKARIIAHMIDYGPDAALFKCKKCGWESGWLVGSWTYSEIKKGVPCERCNES